MTTYDKIGALNLSEENEREARSIMSILNAHPGKKLMPSKSQRTQLALTSQKIIKKIEKGD